MKKKTIVYLMIPVVLAILLNSKTAMNLSDIVAVLHLIAGLSQ